MGDFFVPNNGWKIVVHADEDGGYWGEIPAMPGCVSEGATEEECRANVIEAAEGCMEAYISMAISRFDKGHYNRFSIPQECKSPFDSLSSTI